MASRVVVAWLVGFVAIGIGEEASAQVPDIVYVRCPRTAVEVDMSGDVVKNGVTQNVSRRMRGFDSFDVLPDVVNFFTGFTAPCDLMLREASGAERVLYDCSSTSTDEAACAAMDPAVSFDGRTVAFTVFRGSLVGFRQNIESRVLDPEAEPGYVQNITPEYFPNKHLAATEAQLHLVDVASGQVTELPGQADTFDTGPAFLPNGRLAFTSTRDEHYATLIWGTGNRPRGSRIWTMDLDGRNLDLASHHMLAMQEHPYVLRDGRVVYSSWQIFGTLPFRHSNGSPGSFTTIFNLFHLFTQSPDGAGNFAFYGQHSGDHSPSYFGASHDAAHFVAQTSDERVWFADYYRGNNNGLGVVVGVIPEPEGQEGIGPTEATTHADVFAPRDAINFASWASNADQPSRLATLELNHGSYSDPLPFMGKIGHPGALPQNGLMVAWGKGPCSTVAGNDVFQALGKTAPPLTSGSGAGTTLNVITSLGIDTPSCDVGLYRATKVPSESPADLEQIVDDPAWNEFMARAVVPYSEIMGVERPDVLPRSDTTVSRGELETGTPFGLLGAASIVDRETHPRDGIHFTGELQFGGQGTDTINYADEDLCGVRMLGIMPNRDRNVWGKLANVAGERVAILGEVSVRNKDASGAIVKDATGKPDTSFLLRMPANTPYLMQGIDCDGRTLNTDQSWQALRPGEQKTCGGCHVHSRPAVNKFEDMFAATPEYVIPLLGEGQVPLLAGEVNGVVSTRTVSAYGLQIDFHRDILPIFERRCTAACHEGSTPAGDLALDRPGLVGLKAFPFAATQGETPSSWWCLVADKEQLCLPEGRRFTTGAGADGHTFRRPQLTRYVRAFNSLGSLLYWKAANKRTDGNTDATFTDASPANDRDIDFGADHPTDITPEELGLLSRWIDIGAPGGPEELTDTQKPTLHLAAIIKDDVVTELRVGTVDLGSGIAPASLSVCVVGPNEECEDISGDAEMSGVSAVALSSGLSDLDTEILARVQDQAGNETVVRRTVGWLLNTPPPPPPWAPPPSGEGPDAGPGQGPNSNNPGDDVNGGCGCYSAASSGTDWAFWLVVLCGWLCLRLRRRQA